VQMPETLGLAGPCRYLFAQRTSPGAWDREDIPSSGGLQCTLQAHSLGSVRLLEGAQKGY
jgi:hypothetical protein